MILTNEFHENKKYNYSTSNKHEHEYDCQWN